MYLPGSLYCPIHLQGTNEILRMYIALTGMQHAGKQYQEMLRYSIISVISPPPPQKKNLKTSLAYDNDNNNTDI